MGGYCTLHHPNRGTDHLFAEEFLDILGADRRNLNVISNAGCIVYSKDIIE